MQLNLEINGDKMKVTFIEDSRRVYQKAKGFLVSVTGSKIYWQGVVPPVSKDLLPLIEEHLAKFYGDILNEEITLSLKTGEVLNQVRDDEFDVSDVEVPAPRSRKRKRRKSKAA